MVSFFLCNIFMDITMGRITNEKEKGAVLQDKLHFIRMLKSCKYISVHRSLKKNRKDCHTIFKQQKTLPNYQKLLLFCKHGLNM